MESREREPAEIEDNYEEIIVHGIYFSNNVGGKINYS